MIFTKYASLTCLLPTVFSLCPPLVVLPSTAACLNHPTPTRLAATCSGPMGNHTCGSGRVASDAVDRQLSGSGLGHSTLASA